MEDEIISLGMKTIKEKSEIFGDDAGAFRVSDAWMIFTNDMLVWSTDVVKEMSYEDVGFKVVTMNVSDISAMGGKPMFFAFSIGLPEHDKKVEKGIFEGIQAGLKEYGMKLISADTNFSKELVIDGIAIGTSKKLLLRRNARVGELVCVTGDLGRPLSALLISLKNFRVEEDDRERIFEKLIRARARVEEGQKLTEFSECGIDISDGLVRELKALSQASKVGMVIKAENLPISEEVKNFCEINGLDQYLVAMNSGEEFELVFTVKKDRVDEINFDFTVIGEVIEEKGVFFERNGKIEKPRDLSWRHFETSIL